MIPLTLIQIILIGILAVSGFFAVLHLVNAKANESYYASRYVWIIDFVVFAIYSACCYIIGVIYAFAGYDTFIIYFFLAAGACVLIFMFVRSCFKNKDTMSRGHVVLFVLFMAALMYVTIFTRIGSSYTGVKIIPLDDIQRAVELRDPALAQHMFLNIVMFCPFGYLIPAMNPEKFRKWSVVMLGGLIISTLIEGAQLTVHLGECDIDDIIANTLGSVVGYVIYTFMSRVRKNWKI